MTVTNEVRNSYETMCYYTDLRGPKFEYRIKRSYFNVKIYPKLKNLKYNRKSGNRNISHWSNGWFLIDTDQSIQFIPTYTFGICMHFPDVQLGLDS